MENDKQQEFIGWLADKLQAKDQDDLKKKLQGLGDDGIRKAYDQFLSDKTDVESKRDGGKLDYLRCLQAFAKGGRMEMEKCGCGGKMKEGGLVNRGSIKIGKDQGSRKDSDSKDKNSGKKQSQSSKRALEEPSDKPSNAKVKGDFQKGGKMKKHQTGGTLQGNEVAGDMSGYGAGYGKTTLMTSKPDGTVGPWGNNLPSNDSTKQYMLAPSQLGVNSITQAQYDHLIKNVPNFNQLVGTSAVRNPGEVARFGPEQSDIIRQLLNKYPMPKAVPQQQVINNKTMVPAGDLTARLAAGGRIEDKGENDKPFGGSGIKKTFKTMPKMKSGSRKDVDTKEKTPGKKEYLDKGDKKKEHSAVTKVPTGQAGGQLAGQMGGMMAGAGVRKPGLKKKTPGMQKGGYLGGVGSDPKAKPDTIGKKPTLVKKKAVANQM